MCNFEKGHRVFCPASDFLPTTLPIAFLSFHISKSIQKLFFSLQNDYKDLGQMHYPRYIITALCQDDRQKKLQSRKFWRGSQCKPVEYIVHVLTPRLRSDSHDDTLVPDSLRPFWKFDKVTVTTGCFCSF